jgi:hypothetical protein
MLWIFESDARLRRDDAAFRASRSPTVENSAMSGAISSSTARRISPLIRGIR